MPQFALAIVVGCLLAFWGNGPADVFWSAYLPILLAYSLICPRYRFITLIIAANLWSSAMFQHELNHRLVVAYQNQVSLLQAEVVELPEINQQRIRLYLKVLDIDGYKARLPRLIRLNWYQDETIPRAGERWQFEARLKAPTGFLNPAGFDFQRWQFVKGIHAVGYIRNSPLNRRLQVASRWNLGRWRAHLIATIDHHCVSCQHAGLIKALGIGFRGDITRAQNATLRDSGSAHLLAISGLHIGMVALAFFMLGGWCWRIGLYRTGINRRQAASLFALTAATSYAAMAGFSLPTVRALLMFGIVFAAMLYRKPVNLLQCISLSLILILVIDPLAIGSASFWLSFSALLVIAFAQFRLPRGLRWWKQLLALQCYFSILFVPPGILIFDQFNPASFFANIVAIPLISFVVLPLILVAILLAQINSSLAQGLFSLADTLLGVLFNFLDLLLASGLASLSLAAMPTFLVALLLVAILLLLFPAALPGRGVAMVLLLLPLAWQLPKSEFGDYQVTVFDVGMGTSLLLQTRNHSLIYDFGPGNQQGFSAADWALIPFMNKQAIASTDLMVVSHVDQDHSGGFQSLLEDYQPERLLSGTPNELGARFKLVHRVRSCHGFTPWSWDGVEFRFLSVPDSDSNASTNNRSCVLQVNGIHSLLIAGDIEAGQEAKLVSEYGEDLAADVLLAPHHGSLTSSSAQFVNRVKPQHVIFTLSADNRWGFPKAAVISRYQALASRIYRSDHDGAISLRSSHQGLELKPMRLPKQRIWRTW